jgi:hypothetical protein
MPKVIPGVTLRDPVPDDVKRISFGFQKDELENDVVVASVTYQLVDDGDVVFDTPVSTNRLPLVLYLTISLLLGMARLLPPLNRRKDSVKWRLRMQPQPRS